MGQSSALLGAAGCAIGQVYLQHTRSRGYPIPRPNAPTPSKLPTPPPASATPNPQAQCPHTLSAPHLTSGHHILGSATPYPQAQCLHLRWQFYKHEGSALDKLKEGLQSIRHTCAGNSISMKRAQQPIFASQWQGCSAIRGIGCKGSPTIVDEQAELLTPQSTNTSHTSGCWKLQG